jgi:hypothetical protein
MWVRVWLTGACLAGLLSACSVIDPVDTRYDTVSRSLAKARNESIFLNIVRAAHDYPLSFVTVSNVTPTMTNTSTFGLPSFLFGPGTVSSSANSLFTPGRDVIFGNTTASNATAVGTNFNVSTQETSTFYEGFLKPIDLQTLDYFIRQGYPRELLFWLFTDSFELSFAGRKLGYHYAPPDDYGCSRDDPKHRCFVDWVHIATLSGLTVEEKTQMKSGEDKKASESVGSSLTSGSGSGGGKTTTTIYAHFCFNSILYQQAAALMNERDLARIKADIVEVKLIPDLFGSDLTCGSDGWHPVEDAKQPQSDTFPLKFKRTGVTFSIVPRSAYGVFEFLGTLVKMRRLQMQAPDQRYYPPNNPYISPGRDYALEAPRLLTVHGDQVLEILQNVGGDCFVHTWFNDGDYCVPEQAATTKRIFALLAQLIAIQTAAGDLSITPIVRVIQ